MTRRWAFVTVGLGAGFSGLAIIVTIVSGVPLLFVLAALVFVPVVFTGYVIRRAPRTVVVEIWHVVRLGAILGLAATLAYDVTRTGLSILDPSPYDPFEAIRRFGIGIVGREAGPAATLGAGMVVHAINGASFGVIYAVFAGRWARSWRAALASGLVWGLTLEFLQSILYPGWLGITTVLAEFLVISGLGHICYGLVLGLGYWRLRPRRDLEVGDGNPAQPAVP